MRLMLLSKVWFTFCLLMKRDSYALLGCMDKALTFLCLRAVLFGWLPSAAT
ncbi:hypothetical protein SLEP1_g16246 [Rubroshorea leprosula]|uniref:Uncharacterized protein n=1 Tax=Rubroshorea leprosula TaxID=152421 RepID=A0AAV5J0V6_9ROSI|nr:hypothetical protein SLEP1_g16246 [Rubroshorea leprosula]